MRDARRCVDATEGTTTTRRRCDDKPRACAQAAQRVLPAALVILEQRGAAAVDLRVGAREQSAITDTTRLRTVMPVFGNCSFTFSSMPSSCASVTCVSRDAVAVRTLHALTSVRSVRAAAAWAHRLRYLAALRHSYDHVLHAARLLRLHKGDARDCSAKRRSQGVRGDSLARRRVRASAEAATTTRLHRVRAGARPAKRHTRSCSSQRGALRRGACSLGAHVARALRV